MKNHSAPALRAPAALRPSSVRKVQAILDAAETVFLRSGYADAAMDEVSTRAGVSKQTVYTHFGDKARLFTAVVTRITADATARVHYDAPPPDPDGPEALPAYLEAYGRTQLDIVLDDRLLAVRRLVIAEAPRFPQLAQAFWDQGPAEAMNAMASRFARFADAGLLDVEDAAAAARTFNWLVMGQALTTAMMLGSRGVPAPAERRRVCAEAVRVFLAAHAA